MGLVHKGKKMSSKKQSRLGRKIGVLLEGAREESKTAQSPVMETTSLSSLGTNTNTQSSDISNLVTLQNLFELPLKNLQAGKYQPRRDFEQSELETLADSIRVQGILQPIVVRPIGKEQYEIIAGERRFRAAKIVGLEKIPVVVKEVEDAAAMAMALIENMQREDLSPLEEAFALDRLSKEFGLTHNQVAEAVGKSRAAVTNLLRLLTLADETKELLEKGKIEMGHAKVLLALRGHQQNQVARQVVLRGLSVRETERLVSRFLDESYQTTQKTTPIDPDVRRLQDSLSEKLGAAVQIVYGSQGKGKLVIQYNTLEELDGILNHIQ